MHVLPQLRKLEQAYPTELAVVGVHSPKFTGERPTRNLRQAVLRLGVEHPVVNDPDMTMWSEYGVGAWPTLMLVDPAGRVIGRHEGEFRFEEFQPLIAAMLAEFDANGLLNRQPLPLRPERPPDSPLLFPAKLLADAASGRIFVADSGHDRVVVSTLDGRLEQVIGGQKGFRDGGPDEVAFDTPLGMALDGDVLYVADGWNHSIRRIDLSNWRVTTVAGTGEQARRVKEGPARTSPLNSPWDLALHQGILYIAMAGSHHLWSFDPRTGRVARYAGSGREALVDGPLLRATFAQPSGVATDGRRLYVADSESSSIREVDLPGGPGTVRTLVGLGLFEFGDVDGVHANVRLQHPLAVCYPPLPLGEGQGEGCLFIADSYNHKIKRLDLQTTRTVCLAGNGDPALVDGPGKGASFWEPGGLSLAAGKLYVADTNNHAIRVVDLDTTGVTTLAIQGL
jgi:DNA-binding beta-propeller fold protein YncE